MLNCLDGRTMLGRCGLISNALVAVLLSIVYLCGVAGCGDISNVSAPAGPGPLTITTTSLPDGTVNQPYAADVGGSGGITPIRGVSLLALKLCLLASR